MSSPEPAPSRAQSTLSPPGRDRDYSGFPAYRHRPTKIWYRAYRLPHSPWWFASTDDGRFNLSPPHGTLNTAATPDVAAREVLGKVLVGSRHIPVTAVQQRFVVCLVIPERRAANFLADEAPGFGIVAGDASGAASDYAVTRAWARVLHAAGFEGILSRSRFGTGADPRCLYLFGPAGEHQVGEIRNPVLALASVVERIPGLVVDPIPSSKQITIDP